jgi:hypothetical protein
MNCAKTSLTAALHFLVVIMLLNGNNSYLSEFTYNPPSHF